MVKWLAQVVHTLVVEGKISSETVSKIAELAYLELSEEERRTLAEQLSSIIEYANRIRALDLAEVKPTAHPLPLVNAMRKDEPQAGLGRDEALSQAPLSSEGFFCVPPIG